MNYRLIVKDKRGGSHGDDSYLDDAPDHQYIVDYCELHETTATLYTRTLELDGDTIISVGDWTVDWTI